MKSYEKLSPTPSTSLSSSAGQKTLSETLARSLSSCLLQPPYTFTRTKMHLPSGILLASFALCLIRCVNDLGMMTIQMHSSKMLLRINLFFDCCDHRWRWKTSVTSKRSRYAQKFKQKCFTPLEGQRPDSLPCREPDIQQRRSFQNPITQLLVFVSFFPILCPAKSMCR
ncbi:hypothetical protein F5878DRAFT_634826 [Lentinula raphanica]|uniref:Uncharacterized protein n=1 Tax=Lentinula raphanica TaxID=153919 RepID=A0AA38NY25_9AGAR|nr:hypothetical protein F5878DRAFT_634826 [Lentinula raphanica]